MKKILTFTLALYLLIFPGCKKSDQKEDVSIDKKFAKYPIAVKKDQALKEYLATLAKAEDVKLLGEIKFTTPDGKTLDLAKIQLADDSTGYLESKHLAGNPVVFTENTKGYERPTSSGKSDVIIPKGMLCFTVEEKGSWIKVYIGKINDKWVKDQWIEGGYSTDGNLIIEVKDYELALEMLKTGDAQKKEEAAEALKKLTDSGSIISDKAREALGLPPETAGEPVSEEKIESPSEGTATGGGGE